MRTFLRKRRAFAPREAEKGMSLAELLVVIAILGVITLMTAPYLLDEIRKSKIRGITQQVVSLFQSTRIEAIKKNQPFTIDASDEGITADGISSVNFVSLGETDLELWTEAACFVGYKQLPLVYDAQGKADDKRAVCLSDPRGNVFQIGVDSLQGTPRVRKYMQAAESPSGTAGFFLDGWRWY